MTITNQRIREIAEAAARQLYSVVNWLSLEPGRQWVVLNPWGNSIAKEATQDKAEQAADDLRGKHREVIAAAIRTALEEGCDSRVPPGKRPVSETREAEIRNRDAGFARDLPASLIASTMCRDLLSLLDHERARADQCEAFSARFASDEHNVRAGEELGVAKALAVIEARAVAWKATDGHYPPTYGAHKADALHEVAEELREYCRPATLPPHLETLAENQRLKAALVKIANGEYDNAHDPKVASNLAREALGESS